MDIVGFFAGRVTLCGAEACAVAVLEYVRGRSLSHCRICLEDGRFFATLSAREARLLRQFCEENGIEVSLAENRGFPALFDRYGKRVGLWIGALAVAVMLYACSCVVWDIRIVGNDRLDDSEVIEMLAQSGLSVGAYLGNFDNDAVESRLLREHREIGWVAINVRGTTANVEIVETVYGNTPSGAASDLVAARDGVIERIEVLDGDLRVKVGDVVREGEILAGGIYEGIGQLRTTRAQGQVYARTLREFEVEIPLEGVEKRYTGGEWREISINFFANRIKVFSNTGNMGGSCDIIYKNSSLKMPGGVSLPVGIETARYRAYEECTVRLDGNEAMDKAFSALEQVLEQFVTETGAQLVQKTVSWALDDYAYRIRCTVTCIEDIAREQPIDIG